MSSDKDLASDEKKVERKSPSKDTDEKLAVSDSDRAEFNKEQKQHTEDLKAGKKSSKVTGLLGKVEIDGSDSGKSGRSGATKADVTSRSDREQAGEFKSALLERPAKTDAIERYSDSDRSEKSGDSGEKRTSKAAAQKIPEGATVTTDDHGRIVKTVTANGSHREFGYGKLPGPGGKSSMQVVEITDRSGHWMTSDGKKWENISADGEVLEQRTGTVQLLKDGSFAWTDAKGTQVDQLDGKTVCIRKDGHVTVDNAKGQLEQVISSDRKLTAIDWKDDRVSRVTYPGGKERSFEYGSGGELNKVKELDGTVWTKHEKVPTQSDNALRLILPTGLAEAFDGDSTPTWTSSDGKTWKGTIEVADDGTYSFVDEAGNRTIKTTDGKSTVINAADKSMTVTDAEGKIIQTQAGVDFKKIDEKIEALRKERNATSTDREKVLSILGNLTQTERDVLKDVYEKRHVLSLEEEYAFLKGADKVKFLAALNKKDGDTASQSYDLIIAALETSAGKTSEQSIRNTLQRMNSDDLQVMLNEHPNLPDLIEDSNISDATKKICTLLLKGKDRITDDDHLDMVNIAVKKKDIELFQEVMMLASSDARQRFMDNGGEQKLKDAFEGHWYNAIKYAINVSPLAAVIGQGVAGDVTDAKLNRALEVAKDGKLSVATLIGDNTGVFFNNKEAIEQAIHNMTPEERKQYTRGKELTNKGSSVSELTAEDKEACAYYSKLHTALDKVRWKSRDAEMARLEDLIATPGGGLISKLGAHHGLFLTDSRGAILQDVENIPKAEWERLHYLKLGKNSDGSEPKNQKDKDYNLEQYQQYRNELEKVLGGLKFVRFSEGDMREALVIFNRKMDSSTFEESQDIRRSVEQTLKDDSHFYKNDRQAMAQGLAHMSPASQEKYRTDLEFRKQIDSSVEKAMGIGPTNIDCPALRAAKHMLKNIADGNTMVKDAEGKPVLDKNGNPKYKSPEDIVAKLLMSEQARLEGKILQTAAGIWFIPVTAGASMALTVDALSDGKGKDALLAASSANSLRDIQQSLRDDPKIRERLSNPKTDSDKEFAAAFMKAAKGAMGSESACDTYVKPLIDKGFVPMEIQAKLVNGLLSSDKEGLLKDVSHLAQLAVRERAEAQKQAQAKGQPFDEQQFHAPASDELKRILNDKSYQDKSLSFLSDADRKVALAVLGNADGKIHAEDTVRLKLNHWGGTDDIMTALRNEIKPPLTLDQLSRDYASKYGHDMQAAILDKCTSSTQRTELRHMFAKYANETEAYDSQRESVYASRAGFGSWFAENIARSGVGHQLDDVLNRYTKQIADAHEQFKELPPHKQAELQQKLTAALTEWKKEKGAVASTAADAVIAGIAIGGAAYTGGSSLALLSLVVGGAGAVSNVAIKRAMLGSDYDWDPAEVAKDMLSGAVNGVANVIGPGEAAALFRVGDRAATIAAERTIKSLGEKALKEGGEQVLKKGMQEMMGNALAHGAKDFGEKEVRKLAEKTVAKELSGEAKEQAIKQIEQTITKTLNEQLKKETANFLQQTMREASLNMVGGGMGGGLAGLSAGAFEWDGSKSVEANLKDLALTTASSAAMGAVFAGIMSMEMKAGKEAIEEIKPLFKKGAPEITVNGADIPVAKVDGPQGRVTTVEGTAFGTTGNGDVAVMNTGVGKTHITDSAGTTKELKPGEVVQLKPGDKVAVGDPPKEIALKEGSSISDKPAAPVEAPQSPPKSGDAQPGDSHRPTESGSGTKKSRSAADEQGPVTVRDPIENAPDTVRDGDQPPPTVRERPRELPSAADEQEPPSVRRVLDRGDIPVEQRAAKLETIRSPENKLNAPEVQQALARDGKQMQSRWEPGLDEKIRSSQDEMIKAEDGLRQLLGEKTLEGMPLNRENLLKVAQDNPQHLSAVENYLRVRDRFHDLDHAWDAAISERTSQLQKSADQLAKASDLPKVEVKLAELPPTENGYYSEGRLVLNRAKVLNGDLPTVVETTMHEFVHHQQDVLVLRSMAQERGFNFGKMTPEEVDKAIGQIQMDYLTRIGSTPREDYLKSVLVRTYKEGLSPSDLTRANELIKSLNDLHTHNFMGKDVDAAARNWGRLIEVASNLEGPAGVAYADSMLKSLVRTSAGKQDASVELQRLLEKYKAGELSPEQARKGFKELVDRKIELERDYVKAREKEYVSSAHEIEAWVIGKDVKAVFTGDKPSTTLLDPPPSSRGGGPPTERIGDTGPGTQRGLGDTQGPQTQRNPSDTQGPGTQRGLGDTQGPETQRNPGDTQGPGTQRGLGDTQGPETQRSPGNDQAPETQRSPVNDQAPRITTTADGIQLQRGDVTLHKSAENPSHLDCIEYKIRDGHPVRLQLREDGWYHHYPEGQAPLDGQAVKLHVFAKDATEAGQLQKIIISELQKDPTIAWKTMDPQIGLDPSFAAKAGKSGESIPFTIYAKNPEDAAFLQEKMQQLLEKHKGELNLSQPIRPNAIDKVDPTGRIGIVRDFYSPAAELGSEARIPHDLHHDYRQAVDGYREKQGKPKLESNEHISPQELKMIEERFGYRGLRYDETGSLVARESGAKLDPELASRIRNDYAEKFGLEPGENFTGEQLQQIAQDNGIDPKILAYDKDNDLVLKGTLGHSGDQYGKYFLTPRTGEPATDANAYYKLAHKYGFDPVAAVTFKPGETVKFKGTECDIVGRDGDVVVVRKTGEPPPEGIGIPVSEKELQKSHRQIGNSEYYINSDGDYYKLRDRAHGGKELIADPDAFGVKPERLSHKAADHPPTAQRSPGSDQAPATQRSPNNDKEAVTQRDLPDRQFTDGGGRALEMPGIEASSNKPIDGGEWHSKNKFVLEDGKTMLFLKAKEGGHYAPFTDPIDPAELAPVKGRVLVNSADDLRQVLRIVLPELEKNPQLKALRDSGTINFKIINPEDSGKFVIGEGQGQKGITLYAKDSESLNRALKIIDEALEKHRHDLPPVHPDSLDKVQGTSGRVAQTRDVYAAGIDANGNEMCAARLDRELANRIHMDNSLPHGVDHKITPEGLRQLERQAGLKESSLSYDSAGQLVLSGTPKMSESLSPRKFTLTEAGAERNRLGHEYIDPSTGEKVTSQGLTDRPAMYELSNQYGVDPTNPSLPELTEPAHGGTGHAADTHYPIEDQPITHRSGDIPGLHSTSAVEAQVQHHVREPVADVLKMLGRSADANDPSLSADQLRDLLADQKVRKLLSTEAMRRKFPNAPSPDEQLEILDRYIAARKATDDTKKS